MLNLLPLDNINYLVGGESDFIVADLINAHFFEPDQINNIRGISAGGDTQPGNYYTNNIQYITIATTGDASDFGDMLRAGAYFGTTSDSHGGL